jgi:peptidyl-prolyl cis-trans isomerase A (cyclophilin A)
MRNPATGPCPRRSGGSFLLAALAATVMSCSARSPLLNPAPDQVSAMAPDSFVVDVETSAGAFQIVMHREWSPVAVDRAFYLMRHNFYAGARFYRVVEGFVAQFGFSGRPQLDSVWRPLRLDDEPVRTSNAQGVVSFARGGARTRSYTLFINLADNPRLDTLSGDGVVGFPPIGRVVAGMDAVLALHSGYGNQPRQDSIATVGNAYLDRHFPQLDSIIRTTVRY